MASSPSVTAEAFLHSSPYRSRTGLLLPLRTAVAAAGAAGSVICFMSCFDTGVSQFAAALSAVIACVLFGTAFCLKRSFILPCTCVLSAGFIAAVFFLRNNFCNGLANVINIYLGALKEEYRQADFIEILSPDTLTGDTTVFFILTAFFIGMVYSWGLVRHCSLPAVMTVSVLPVELCLYFGFVPDYTAFFAVIASLLSVFAGDLASPDENNGTDRSNRKAVSQSIFAAAALVMLCAALVTGIIRLSGYQRPKEISDFYENVTDYIRSGKLENDIEEIRINEIIKREHTINHGELGTNGNITFSGDTILQVTMPKSSETVYLRGFVGSVYTGRSWEELPESSLNALDRINDGFRTEGLDTMLLSSYNLKMTDPALRESSFTVKNISSANDYYYVPYNLVPESVRHYMLKNDTVISGGADSWFGRFYSDPTSVYGYRMLLTTPWTVPNLTLAQDISSYRNFVYSENYLALPDEFKGADEVFDERYYSYITDESGSEGKSTLTESIVFGRKLYYIRSWLRDNCEYSLKAGKLPADKDFADYFITETKAGSCSHFATAAALLCRYAGIPSRYVEGFVIKPADFDADADFGSMCTVDVTDARAHAWVEIYIDGFGWYPMEFTSGYGNVMTAVTTAPATEKAETQPAESQPDETISEAEQPSSTAADGSSEETAQYTTVTTITSPEGTETAASEETAVTTPVPNDETGFSIFGGSSEGGSYKKVYDLTIPLIAAVCVCAVIAFFWIRRWLLVKSCSEISKKENAALLQYRRFLKVVKAAGLPSKGQSTYSEYAEKLSRSPVVSDSAEIIISTALKAAFSGERLSSAENDDIRRAVDRTVKRYLGSLSKSRRFYAEFIKGIV